MGVFVNLLSPEAEIGNFVEISMVGFLAQIIDGTLGMGYGVSSSALLVSMGMPPVAASASIHSSEIFISLVSGLAHFKFGNVKINIIRPLISFGIIGGIIGACGLVKFPVNQVKIVVGLVLMCMGLLMLYRFIYRQTKTDPLQPKMHSLNKLRALGFFAAFIDAFGGGGWGPVCTPALVMGGTVPNKAVGSVNLAEFFITLAISITFYFLIGFGNIHWEIILALLAGGIIGAPIAAFVCGKLPKRVLGLLVAITVIILSCRILIFR